MRDYKANYNWDRKEEDEDLLDDFLDELEDYYADDPYAKAEDRYGLPPYYSYDEDLMEEWE